MNHEEAKRRLLKDPKVREAYENPPLPLAVARAVVERRRELGLSQEQLATMIDSSQSQVWRIESGDFNPTLKTLSKLETALGIPLRTSSEEVHTLSPEEQIEEWRRSGFLIMSDEDFQDALELENLKPGQLRNLVRTIQRIKDTEGTSTGSIARLSVKVEYESVRSKAAAEPDPRRKHLELVAAF